MSDRPFLDILAILVAFKSGSAVLSISEQYKLTVPEVEGIIRVFVQLSERHRLEVAEVEGILTVSVHK